MSMTANSLLARFKHVAVVSHRECQLGSVRFRADDVMKYPVFFAKVPSQIKLWKENGGCIVSWNRCIDLGPHDAMIVVQPPRMVRLLHMQLEKTRYVAVVAKRYQWEPWIEVLRRRCVGKPKKEIYDLRELAMMRRFMENLPVFTPSCLLSIQPAPVSFLSSCVLSQPEGAARVADKQG